MSSPNETPPSVMAVASAMQAAGWGKRSGEYLYESSLSDAASRIRDLLQSAGVTAQYELRGAPDKAKWQIEVKVPGQRGYIVIQQRSVLCLHPSRSHTSSTIDVSLEDGIRWLLSVDQLELVSHG